MGRLSFGRRCKMGLRHLGSELGRWQRRHQITKPLHAAAIVARANEVAEGRFVARSYRAGTLYVEVATPAARSALQSVLPAILAACNAGTASPVVREVKFRLARPR